jgi:PAS domain S-box-containing protein
MQGISSSPIKVIHAGIFLLVLVVFFFVLATLISFNWYQQEYEFKQQFLWFVSIVSCIFVLLLSAYAYATLKHTRNIEHEISKRLSAEHQMRLFEAAVVHSQDAILISKIHGNRDEVIYVNEAFHMITGFTAEEVIGKSRAALWKGNPPQQILDEKDTYLQGIPSGSQEIEFLRRDGKTIWIQRNMVFVRDERGDVTHIITSKRDITNQIEYHRQLMEQKAKAEQLSRLKSDFLATMSHEIRTPMNGIIGMTGLLLDTELTQQQRGYVGTINNSADSLLTIINDILDFSKIESGRLQFESIPFNLRSAAEDVLDLLTVRAREKGLELLLRYTPNTPQMVVGDPGRIRQILYNLVGNSIKFTTQGHVLITVEMESCSVVDPTVSIKLSVSDTGIGIPQEKLPHIFDKFTQADSSTTRRFGGSGLGLAICKQLARLMHGDIGVDSTLGEGSVFWFSVRLHLATEPAHESVINHGVLRGKRLLMVDDVAINHAIIEEQLLAVGIRSDFCLKGMDAMRLMYQAEEENDPYDFAIIDYLMPDINGEELATILKRNKRLDKTKLIMLTAADERKFSKTLSQAGFVSVLTKPLRQQMLLDTLAIVSDPKNQAVFPHPLHYTAPQPVLIERQTFPGVRVLVAEDNIVNQQVAIQMLSKLGCQVTAVANGQEAIDLLREMSFDLIFMDCQMPEMDGFEASRVIRTLIANGQFKAIPIIAVTANAMQGDREKCLLAGMQDYIAKPIQSKDLEHMLSKWIGADLAEKNGAAADRHAIQIVDRHVFDGLMELMGDNAMVLLQNYLETSPNYIEHIDHAINTRDPALLVKASHPLKSSSASLGLASVKSIAADLEKIGRNYQDNIDWHVLARELVLSMHTAHKEAIEWLLRYQENNRGNE